MKDYDLLFPAYETYLRESSIEVTKENKRDIDEVIHKIVGVPYKNCSATWREVRKRIAEDEDGFINSLKNEAVSK